MLNADMRPPDKHRQQPSEQDIHSSNVTLNTLFGGSRQKAWMLGPQAQPTPRQSLPKPSSQATLAHRTDAAIISAPSRGTERSPKFTSSPPKSRPTHPRKTSQSISIASHTHIQGRRISSGETPGLFTSPASAKFPPLGSAEAAHRSTNSAHIGQPCGDSSFESQPPVEEVVNQSTIPNQPFSREELRSPSPDEVLNPQQVSQINLFPTTEPPLAPPSMISVDAQAAVQLLEDPRLTPAQIPQFSGHTQQTYVSSITAPISTNISTNPQAHIQHSPTLGSPQEHPNKRRRIGHQPHVPISTLIVQIDHHIQSVGGYKNLNTGLERPRFQLLKEACINEDMFYVALHQIFIIWSIRPDEIAHITGFPAPKLLDLAFGIMGQLIRDNTQLAPNHLKWFSDFPAPLQQLLTSSDAYSRVVAEVGSFLWKLALDWNSISLNCRSRGYPPLVDELEYYMGLLSPIFQGVVFTAIRRNLDIGDGDIGTCMESLFKKDQQDHQSLEARYSRERPPTADEINKHNGPLTREYTNLHQQLLQRRSTIPLTNGKPRGGVPLPPDASNIAAAGSMQNSTMLQVHQPDVQASIQNVSFASMGNAQVHGQSMQATPRRTISSPTPSIPAAYPLSRGPQATYSNTPSPTLLQGLTMQSPVQQNYLFAQGFRRASGHGRVISDGMQSPAMIPNSANSIIAIQNNQPGLQPQVNMNVQQHSNQQVQPNMYLQHSLADMSAQQREPQQMQQQQLREQSNLQQLNIEQTQPNIASLQQSQIEWQQNRNHPRTSYAAHQPSHYSTSQQAAQQQLAQRQLAQQQLIQQQSIQQQLTQQQLAQQQLAQQQYHVLQMQQNNSPQYQPHSHAWWQLQKQQKQQAIANERAAQMRMSAQSPLDPNINPHSGRSSGTSRGLQTFTVLPSIVYSPRSSVSSQRSFREQAEIAGKAYAASPGHQRSIYPPTHFIHPPRTTQPHVTALHQAYLRSPRLVPAVVPLPDLPAETLSLRYYQVIRDCIVPPTKLGSKLVSHFDFVVQEHDFRMIPVDTFPGGGQVALREFKQGMLQYRLRCIPLKDIEEPPTSEWVVNENVHWPDTTCLEINGQRLEIRRKNHHGKDLPIDVTHFIRANGPGSRNRISFILTKSRRPDEPTYFFAVEVIEIFQHNQILDMCQQHRIPAHVTVEKIKRSLAPLADDDEDVAIVASDLSIDLVDPYTARIFVTPVRGRVCHHRECFDLETFLETRNSKPKRPQQPTLVDMWRCPICSCDARPQELVIDDFLVSVRADLIKQGLADVKAIWIDKDGKWRPKVNDDLAVSENGPAYDEESEDDEERRMMGALKRNAEAQNSVRQKKGVPEVINLDDD